MITNHPRLDYRPKLLLFAIVAGGILVSSAIDFMGSASSRNKPRSLTSTERHLRFDQTQGFSETLLPSHLKQDHGGIASSYSRDIDGDGKLDRAYVAGDGSVFTHLTSLENPLKGFAYAPGMFLMTQQPTTFPDSKVLSRQFLPSGVSGRGY